LPRAGKTVAQFGNIGVVESVKAVSDLFTPIGGEIVEVNAALEADPALVNRDPYGEGWLFKVKVSDTAETGNLLKADEYEKITVE
jgi:glycine cleavage system H protein